MSYTFMEAVKLESTTCARCGVMFAMPAHLMQTRREDGATLYCPNGHNLSFGDCELERTKRALQQKTDEANRQRENYFAEQRKHEETQRKLGRLKKRTAAGTCPCCKRIFSQLSRHMQGKHPDFVKEHGVPIVAEPKA